MADGPVFAFAVHRSGSTLLGRILNCHPDLVVWGEHSGFINNLAEMDFVIRQNWQHRHWQSGGSDAEWMKSFVSDAAFRSSKLEPWTMLPHAEDVKKQARELIRQTFVSGLRPKQRWGFKEIRYYRPYVADFLADLFPLGRFVLLTRDVADAAVSNILANWMQEDVKALAASDNETQAEEVIRDVVYALLAFKSGFESIKEKHTAKCFEVNYVSLRKRDVSIAHKLLKFIGLSVTPEVERNIEKAFSIEFNQTKKVPWANKVLTAEFIKERAAAMVPALQAEINAHGVDRARLESTVPPGKYSFLLGGNRSAYLRI